ncbi:UvrB/UvrC motif-containing protein [Candidatus Wolfebacteria bacterium]|nr:UvrB/UvrC motif-containing protein [Candidatus Wolfebacteria bacterium]
MKLTAQVQRLPDTPGVYFFIRKTKNKRPKAGKDILYIGKATSLRDRVRGYFSADIAEVRGPLIVKMLAEATGVSYEQTDSVLEALILEAALIKKHQPLYNVKEKDDKSFNYVVITDEPYPRVFTLRGRELKLRRFNPDASTKLKAGTPTLRRGYVVITTEDYPRVFTLRERELPTTNYKLLARYGPFPHGAQLKDALRIVRKIFPFRGEKDAVEPKKKRRSALNQELGIAPDFARVTKREYARTVRHVKLFFEGKKRRLLGTLEREMKAHARKKEFEKAAEARRQLFALEHIRDVSLIKGARPERESQGFRVEGYDVAHTAGVETVGVMVVVEDGEPNKNEYRKFKLSGKGGDTGGLKEILERRLRHDEWTLPKLIVVDGGKAQLGVAERALKEFGYQIPVVAVTKNERHRPERILGANKLVRKHERDILVTNSEAHRFAVGFHRKRRGRVAR